MSLTITTPDPTPAAVPQVVGIDLGQRYLATLTTPDAFLAGIALALVFCLGVALAVASVMRARHHRAALLAERREAIRIRAERDELAARLGLGVNGKAGDDLERTTPLAPSIFPWANPW